MKDQEKRQSKQPDGLSYNSERGHAASQYWFSEIYRLGKMVDHDADKANIWLEKSKQQNHLPLDDLLTECSCAWLSWE